MQMRVAVIPSSQSEQRAQAGWLRPLSAWFSAALLLCLLNGCGFQLRQEVQLPEAMRQLHLNYGKNQQALANSVTGVLKKNKANLTTSTPVLTLKLVNDSVERRTLSLFNNGQVAEFELIYKVEYAVQFTGKDWQSFTFELTRNYQDDPDNPLAKNREMTLIMSEVRVQAARRIVRQLSTLPVPSNS